MEAPPGLCTHIQYRPKVRSHSHHLSSGPIPANLYIASFSAVFFTCVIHHHRTRPAGDQEFQSSPGDPAGQHAVADDDDAVAEEEEGGGGGGHAGGGADAAGHVAWGHVAAHRADGHLHARPRLLLMMCTDRYRCWSVFATTSSSSSSLLHACMHYLLGECKLLFVMCIRTCVCVCVCS